jgi:hypothetical protein
MTVTKCVAVEERCKIKFQQKNCIAYFSILKAFDYQ